MTKHEFTALYAECLADAINAKPNEYGYPASDAPAVAEKMTRALDTGGVTITNSDGFKRLAKKLGIKYTARDITAAWKQCTEVQ
jgi:hypothetical protein